MTTQARGMVALFVALLAAAAAPRTSRADSVGVLALKEPPGPSVELIELTRQLRAAAAERDRGVLEAAALRERMTGETARASLAELDRAYAGALATYQNGEFDAAVRTLHEVADDLERLPDGPEVFAQWTRVEMRLARLEQTLGHKAESARLIDRLVRADPSIKPDATQYPPSFGKLFKASRARLAKAPKGELRVDSTPKGARVFVDGLDRGATPLVLELPRGKVRVSARLDDLRVPRSTVEVASEPQALALDFAVAQALRPNRGPGLALPEADRQRNLVTAGAFLGLDRLIAATLVPQGDVSYLVGSIYDIRRGMLLREGRVRVTSQGEPQQSLSALASFLLTGEASDMVLRDGAAAAVAAPGGKALPGLGAASAAASTAGQAAPGPAALGSSAQSSSPKLAEASPPADAPAADTPATERPRPPAKKARTRVPAAATEPLAASAPEAVRDEPPQVGGARDRASSPWDWARSGSSKGCRRRAATTAPTACCRRTARCSPARIQTTTTSSSPTEIRAAQRPISASAAPLRRSRSPACSSSSAAETAPPRLRPARSSSRGAALVEAAAQRGWDATRWDLFEEHLDEAAFLYGQWEAALRSPDYTLAEIAAGPEERLLAHLDGLLQGGAPVAQRLLLPALGSDEAGFVFAAGFALACGGREGDLEAVLVALSSCEPPQRAALRRALSVAPCPDLAERLRASLLAATAPESAAPGAPGGDRGEIAGDLLEVLGYLRCDPGVGLEPLFASRDPDDAARALRLGRVFPDRLDPAAVERDFRSGAPAVRAAALVTGMLAGMPAAKEACATTLRARGPGVATAALLLGLSGEERWVAPLAALLSEPALASAAAFALGLTGRLSAADALVGVLGDDELAPLAAEGFAAITGLALSGRFLLPPRRSSPGTRPAPEAIARYWAEERPRLAGSGRYLRGEPYSLPAVLRELETCPARRREALAVGVALLSHGKAQLAWDALSARQLAELRSFAALGGPRVPAPRVWPAAPAKLPGAAPGRLAAPLRRATPRPSHALAITGRSLVTSLGEVVEAEAAAARAGIARPGPLADVAIVEEEDGEPGTAVCHLVPLAAGFVGLGKQVRLASLALEQLVRTAPLPKGRRTGLLLALGSGYYLDEADLWREQAPDKLLDALLACVEVPGGVQHREAFATDAPGFVAALASARDLLAAGKVDRVLVGGVDSLAEPLLVEALARLDWLKTKDNPCGLMPGEGAAFVLVERPEAAQRSGAQVHGWIDAVAVRAEPAGTFAGAPQVGLALSAAIAAVLPAPKPGALPAAVATAGPAPDADPTRLVIADLNGTAARAQDWGTAQVRLRRADLRAAEQWYPAVHFGDLGAASTGAALALATEGFARAYARSTSALVWAASDAGGRGALLVRAP